MRPAIVPQPTQRETGDELDHLYCCDPDIALCGTDISGHEDNDASGTCVVCLDLEWVVCWHCGS